MRVGPSPRGQMERALSSSSFGVVLLSNQFFLKKWTIEELDGLFALERPGETRILPVWFRLTADEVRTHSPMLAGRAAAVLDDDFDTVGDKLLRSVVELSASKSFGARIRAEIATGLRWVNVQLFPQSFELLDAEPDTFIPAELVIYPALPKRRPPRQDMTALSLSELHSACPIYDGRQVATVAHQIRGTLQILADRGPATVVWREAPDNARLVSYVFQLRSVDSVGAEATYVHAVGPYEPEFRLSESPNDWLTWVFGTPLARGTTRVDDQYLFTSYLLASSIFYTPRLEPGRA